MIRFLINVIELVIIAKVLYKIARFFMTGKFSGKKYKRSVFRKVSLLVRNKAHDYLDDMLKSQRAKRLAKKESQQVNSRDNVVVLQNYKKAKIR